MLTGVRLILTIASAAVIMLALANSSSARNFSTSSQSFRATWREMEFREPVGQIVRCPVTLEGTLHSRTIAKGNYNLIGNITRVELLESACQGGTATVLRGTLPWNIRYQGFTGRLPTIELIMVLIANAAFRVRGPFLNCLITSRETLTEHWRGTILRDTSTGELETVSIGGVITSNEFCGPFGERLRGTMLGNSVSLTVLNAATMITVTLI